MNNTPATTEYQHATSTKVLTLVYFSFFAAMAVVLMFSEEIAVSNEMVRENQSKNSLNLFAFIH